MDLDFDKNKKKSNWISLFLRLGAGLGLGYFLYKSYFSKSKIEKSIDKLSQHQAIERSSIIKDLKYNLFLKLRYIHEENNPLFQHQRAGVKGVLEIEMTLLEVKDLILDFSGFILEFTNTLRNEKVKYSHDNETKKIFLNKTNFIRGINKFSIQFSVKDCDKGIIFNDQVKRIRLNSSFFYRNRKFY